MSKFQVQVNEHLLLPTCNGELRLACKLYTVKGLDHKQHAVRLVCYPGWLDNSGSFDDLATFLCGQFGYALLTVDPPGCGLSDHRPKSQIYNDYEEPPLISDLADAIGWDTFGIIGHSRGGGVAGFAAGMMRTRIKVLVGIDSVFALSGMYIADVLPGAPIAPDRMVNAWTMSKKNYTRPTRVFANIDEAVEASVNHEFFKKSVRGATNIVKRHTRPCAGGITFTHDVRTYGQLQCIHMKLDHYKEFLGSITAPVLQIMDNTRAKQIKVWEERYLLLRSLLKQEPTVIDFTGLGHHMHCDHPEKVGVAIGQWVDAHYSSSSNSKL